MCFENTVNNDVMIVCSTDSEDSSVSGKESKVTLVCTCTRHNLVKHCLFSPRVCFSESRRWKRRRLGVTATQKKGWTWRRSVGRVKVPICQKWKGQLARVKMVMAHLPSATLRILWPAAQPLLLSCRCRHSVMDAEKIHDALKNNSFIYWPLCHGNIGCVDQGHGLE